MALFSPTLRSSHSQSQSQNGKGKEFNEGVLQPAKVGHGLCGSLPQTLAVLTPRDCVKKEGVGDEIFDQEVLSHTHSFEWSTSSFALMHLRG